LAEDDLHWKNPTTARLRLSTIPITTTQMVTVTNRFLRMASVGWGLRYGSAVPPFANPWV
jgi:hypothetical protein